MRKYLRSIRKWILIAQMARRYEGPLARKIKFFQIAKNLWKRGIVDFRIDRVADLYVKDWFNFEGTTKEQKKWAYSHGFSSYKMAPWYGVTPENYKNYVSDFDFYAKRSYIKNPEIVAWFDNKLATYYLLSPFKSSMPRHYFYIEDKRIMPLDIELQRDGTVDDIICLINNHPIAAKACHGGHGVGFYMFSYTDGNYMINNKKVSKDDLKECILSLSDYIITDYCKPHKLLMDSFGEDSFAVLRMITVFDVKEGPQITCSVIRIGCKAAGLTTDHEGTIYCGLTLDEGKFFNPLYRVADNRYDPITNHPDTDKIIEGTILPNYSGLKELVKSVASYLPMTPYLVMDILPTQDGFSILEINSHGQVGNVEPFYPFCANKYNRRVFGIEQ